MCYITMLWFMKIVITLVTDEGMSMEHQWNEILRKTKYLKKNLFQYHFVHLKFCMDWSGICCFLPW